MSGSQRLAETPAGPPPAAGQSEEVEELRFQQRPSRLRPACSEHPISRSEQRPHCGAASAYSKKTKSRQSNSLDELTKKFMRYVMEAKNSSINLNSVMKKIKVKKRRIYDITNVLEGKSFI